MGGLCIDYIRITPGLCKDLAWIMHGFAWVMDDLRDDYARIIELYLDYARILSGLDYARIVQR